MMAKSQQDDAVWSLSENNTVATQERNADASILLSDIEASGKSLIGELTVSSASDDDIVGLVFGYQGRGRFYLFDWVQTTQFFSGFGTANEGMRLRLIEVPDEGDPTGPELWDDTGLGSTSVALLRRNNVGWLDNEKYTFEITYDPGQFSITIRQGGITLESWTVEDDTYVSGFFGFYNYSQQSSMYTLTSVKDTGSP